MPPPPRSRTVRRLDDDADLADEVDTAAAELDLAARSEDIADGLVPVWASRSLHPHELAARVSFAAIDRNETDTAGRIARRLTDDRAAFARLLAAGLALLTTGREVVDRLVALEVAGLAQIAGVAELVNSTATDVGAALRQHADLAGNLVVVEAGAQGVTPTGSFVLDDAAVGQLEQLAARLAVAPHVDLLRALRDEAVRLPTPTDAATLTGRLATVAAELSPAPLEQMARNATSQADGLGRQAAAVTVGVPVAIYASELLDGATCGPCSLIDGTGYDTLTDARLDYPNGIYVRCEGRDRCRGTLVFVWASEAPPTT